MTSLLIALTGCSSTVERAVKDGVSGAINGVINSSSSTISTAPKKQQSSGHQTNYSVKSESVYTTEAKRTSRDYGSIAIVKTEQNPSGKTRLAVNQSIHPRVGKVNFQGYLYEVSPEGWLIDKKIHFSTRYNDIVVPAGTYYMKVESRGVGKESYTTGTFTISPFVTNFVNLELE